MIKAASCIHYQIFLTQKPIRLFAADSSWPGSSADIKKAWFPFYSDGKTSRKIHFMSEHRNIVLLTLIRAIQCDTSGIEPGEISDNDEGILLHFCNVSMLIISVIAWRVVQHLKWKSVATEIEVLSFLEFEPHAEYLPIKISIYRAYWRWSVLEANMLIPARISLIEIPDVFTLVLDSHVSVMHYLLKALAIRQFIPLLGDPLTSLLPRLNRSLKSSCVCWTICVILLGRLRAFINRPDEK